MARPPTRDHVPLDAGQQPHPEPDLDPDGRRRRRDRVIAPDGGHGVVDVLDPAGRGGRRRLDHLRRHAEGHRRLALEDAIEDPEQAERDPEQASGDGLRRIERATERGVPVPVAWPAEAAPTRCRFQATATRARIKRTTRPWCSRADWKAETMVGLFVLRPVLMPGIALYSFGLARLAGRDLNRPAGHSGAVRVTPVKICECLLVERSAR